MDDLAKLPAIGIDLLLIPAKKLSEASISPVELMDLFLTLCWNVTLLLKKLHNKAYRSLHSYNKRVSGFLCSVLDVRVYMTNKTTFADNK